MQPLLHKEVQQLTGLLRVLVDAFQLHTDREPELNRSLLALLDLSVATYRECGRPDRESRVASLRAELSIAFRGINPVTLEKPAVRRHEMQSAIAFKVLKALEEELRGSFQQATDSLQRAEDLVGQIIIAGVQKGLISDAAIRDTTTQDTIEELWRSIAADADIALAQKRVLLLVSSYDAYLLIDKVFSGLRGS